MRLDTERFEWREAPRCGSTELGEEKQLGACTPQSALPPNWATANKEALEGWKVMCRALCAVPCDVYDVPCDVYDQS